MLGTRPGGVAGYLLLLKVYFFTALVVVAMASAYHIYLIHWVCGSFRVKACVRGFGIWVISQSDLTDAMLAWGIEVTFFKALQLVLFLWLSLVNVLTVYLLTRLSPAPEHSSQALLLGNLPPSLSDSELTARVQAILGQPCTLLRLGSTFTLHSLHERRLHLLFRLKHKAQAGIDCSRVKEQLRDA